MGTRSGQEYLSSVKKEDVKQLPTAAGLCSLLRLFLNFIWGGG